MACAQSTIADGERGDLAQEPRSPPRVSRGRPEPPAPIAAVAGRLDSPPCLCTQVVLVASHVARWAPAPPLYEGASAYVRNKRACTLRKACGDLLFCKERV